MDGQTTASGSRVPIKITLGDLVPKLNRQQPDEPSRLSRDRIDDDIDSPFLRKTKIELALEILERQHGYSLNVQNDLQTIIDWINSHKTTENSGDHGIDRAVAVDADKRSKLIEAFTDARVYQASQDDYDYILGEIQEIHNNTPKTREAMERRVNAIGLCLDEMNLRIDDGKGVGFLLVKIGGSGKPVIHLSGKLHETGKSSSWAVRWENISLVPFESRYRRYINGLTPSKEV